MSRLLLLLLLLLTSSCATTTTIGHVPEILHVHREARDGMRPRCFTLDGPLNLFLRWNDADRYARVVEATRDARPCGEWRSVVKDRQQGWVVVAEDAAANVFGLRLGDRVHRELAQVRDGAHDLRDDDNVPSIPYDLDANTTLTDRYGHGFSGAVYARSVEATEKNAWAKRVLLKDMERTLAGGEAAAIAEMKALGDVHVLVSMGLGWDEAVDEHTVPYVKTFIETVKSIGLPVEVLERNTFGGLEENAALLAATIEKHLAQGHDIVLFGLCKGSPELFAAAATATSSSLDEHRRQTKQKEGRGRIRGVVNMSGMLSGILFSDWIAPFEGPLTATGHVLKAIPLRSMEETGSYMVILPQLTTEKVEAFKASFVKRLPSDVVYVDVSGVVPDDGLLKRDVGAMGPFIQMDRQRDLAKAANDGFVRYPGNELPDDVSDRHYVVVVQGSHMLFDGAFGPWSLEDTKNQRALFQSVVRFVLADEAPKVAARNVVDNSSPPNPPVGGAGGARVEMERGAP